MGEFGCSIFGDEWLEFTRMYLLIQVQLAVALPIRLLMQFYHSTLYFANSGGIYRFYLEQII